MDANSGQPWSETDISDLTNEIARGRTVAQTPRFLRRDQDEVREGLRLPHRAALQATDSSQSGSRRGGSLRGSLCQGRSSGNLSATARNTDKRSCEHKKPDAAIAG
jgi:hypothetical protein